MTEIFVKLRVPGFHYWPKASTNRAYLGERHRHLFHLVVSMVVGHADREVEFHDLLDEVRRLFPVGEDHFGKSCEMMAQEMGHTLATKYNRPVTVEVSEDGEVGARVTVDDS